MLVKPPIRPSSPSYQLRALTGNKIEEEEELRHCLNQRLNADTLSLKLIEETLNYFISCKQRLIQITKTFDDSNALIMLLQEKEEDLEVVGQLGQDLLRRYNELKEAYEGQRQELARFQEELSKSHEDNQQLKYELASNKSLLDTFKEEEEHLLDERNNTPAGARVCSQCQADEEGQAHSLRSQADRSLTYLENELYKQMCELKDELMEVREREMSQKLQEQERNLQLELQLRANERRQTDLEGENESLRDQQRELQQVIEAQSRRFDELLGIFSEYQREARAHYLNSGASGSNSNNISFNHLTESSPSFESQLNSLLFLHQPHHVHQHQDTQGSPQPVVLPATPISPNQQIVRPIVRKSSSSNLVTSTSLHEELLESMHKISPFHESNDDDDSDDDDDDDDDDGADDGQAGVYDDGEERDGADSGLHTRNISTSTTPVNSAGISCLDTDSDDAAATAAVVTAATRPSLTVDSNNNDSCASDEAAASNLSKRLKCLGLSTFTLTTLLLLCLSATFNSTTNSNLAQKLQQINLNQ